MDSRHACLLPGVIGRGVERPQCEELAFHEETSRGVALDELLPRRVSAHGTHVAYNDEAALCTCESNARASRVAEEPDRLARVRANK